MKTGLVVLAFLCSSLTAFGAPAAAEWKGTSPDTLVTLGAQGGMSIRGGSVGGVILGSVGFKVLNRGFIGGDINDQVFFELQAGPEFIFGTTLLGMSGHLKWVFHRNEEMSAYAIGGMGTLLGSGVTWFHPRFGIGALYHLAAVSLRAEISDHWVLLGAQIGF